MIRSISALAVLALASAAFAGSTTPVWYGGDPDLAGGANYFSEVGSTAWPNNQAYDDFIWSSNGVAGCAWGNFVSDNANITSVFIEIRSGITPGNGGIVHYSNTVAATQTFLGGSIFGAGFDSYRIEGQINANLIAGNRYWLTVAPVMNGPFVAAAYQTLTGANSVGGPILNNNVFLNGPTFNWADPNPGAPSGDMSYGIGTAVPEPATMAALGLGLAAVARRRKRK